MKFDASKIRAARALLDWGQRDLAERSGVSHMAITNLEQGKTEPQSETIEKIQNAFELAGVIITPKGVEYKDVTVTTMEGDGWYLRLLDDVYYTLLDKPDAEYLTMCADDTVCVCYPHSPKRVASNRDIYKCEACFFAPKKIFQVHIKRNHTKICSRRFDKPVSASRHGLIGALPVCAFGY